jgi:hypothetical protein
MAKSWAKKSLHLSHKNHYVLILNCLDGMLMVPFLFVGNLRAIRLLALSLYRRRQGWKIADMMVLRVAVDQKSTLT